MDEHGDQDEDGEGTESIEITRDAIELREGR